MHNLAEKALPSNLDAERFVLGSALLDENAFPRIAGKLETDDFSIDKHRRIFARMRDLADRGERLDRVTVANELMTHGQLESCDGLTYLVSLDDGLPQTLNIESYIRIVKEKATARRLVHIGQSVMDRAMGSSPVHEIISDTGTLLLELGAQQESKGPIPTGRILDEFPGGLNALLSPHLSRRGLQTGFILLDRMTGGLDPGELILIAARPSMGKTALALNIAANIALRREPAMVAVFSLEMSRESLLTRLIISDSRVDSQKFRHGHLGDEERRRLQVSATRIAAAPIYIDDTASVNMMDISAKCRLLKAEAGLDLVIIDYLQLMSGSKGSNRNEEVSGISRGMKLLAKDLNIPVIALSQLSRGPENRAGDHRPMLADLRDSGSLEQDADKIGLIYREEVYKKDREDLRGQAKLILSKQRNGPVGDIDLLFLHHCTRFENLAGDLE